jgi:hypothetical protein
MWMFLAGFAVGAVIMAAVFAWALHAAGANF